MTSAYTYLLDCFLLPLECEGLETESDETRYVWQFWSLFRNTSSEEDLGVTHALAVGRHSLLSTKSCAGPQNAQACKPPDVVCLSRTLAFS